MSLICFAVTAFALQVLATGREAVDPATYRSPNGAALLFVDPSRVNGAGHARYELTRDGELAWTREHPFTLREVVVTDEGRAFGYALPDGERRGGELHLIVLGPEGDLLRLDARPYSPMSCTSFLDPSVDGLMHTPRADVFVARLGHAFDDEEWAVYDAATGADVARTFPTRGLGDYALFGLGCEALLDELELYAVGWLAIDFGSAPARSTRPVFALVTPRGEVVWRETGEPFAPGPKRGELRDRVLRERPTLVRGTPGGFEAWSPTERVLRRYDVRRSEGGFEVAGEGWAVDRGERRSIEGGADGEGGAEPMPLGRDDLVGDALRRRLAADALALPTVELDEIGRAALAPPSGARDGEPAAGDVAEAVIDRLGRVIVLEREAKLVRVWDHDGARLWTAPLQPYPELAWRTHRVATGRGGEVLLEALGDPDGTYAVRARVGPKLVESGRRSREFAAGTNRSWSWGHRSPITVLQDEAFVTRIERLPSNRWITRVDAAFGLGDGGVLVLADGELAEFGPDGEPHGTVELPYEGGNGMFSCNPAAGPSHVDTLTANHDWALASSSSPEAWLVDRRTGAVHLFAPPVLESGRVGAMAIAPDANEVLVFVRETLELVRYALP